MKYLPLLAVTATTTAATTAFVAAPPAAARRISSRTPLNSATEENGNMEAVTTTTTVPPSSSKNKEVVMSKSIPFLKCPKPLIDCELAGNFGFDPVGFCQSPDDVTYYREAEVKHARLAMLAAAGWPLSEIWDRPIAETFQLPTLLDSGDRVPSVLNGHLDSVSPIWWGTCLGLTAAIDLYGISKARQNGNDPTYFPGKLDFDPLGLYPKTASGRARMQLAEIKNGRVAMVAVLGFAVQEYVTQMGVVDETPWFFHPLF